MNLQPPMTSLSGLLNLYKPEGPTSHDIVAWVRFGTRIKKVGHAGTLDPMASGVLVLCLGSATRLSEYVMESSKSYRARVRLGIETDSYDAEGTVIAENPAPVSQEAVEAALAPFRGTFGQLPPMHSAIKQDGKRLYKLARAGREVERTPRTVTISRLELTGWEPPCAVIEIDCTPGTYIRSLAHDLGAALGVGAHLAALERTASGQFKAADAVPWPDFYAALQAKTWQQYLLPPDLALAGAPAVHLSADEAAFIRLGGYVTAQDTAYSDGQLARGYDPEGQLCAVLERRGDQWKPHKVFEVES